MSEGQRKEFEDLVCAEACALSDLTLILAHTVAAKKYDAAAQAICTINRKTNIVAGYIGQLLPVVRTTDIA